VFEQALALLRSQGAVLVDIDTFPDAKRVGELEGKVLSQEIKTDLASYLATTDPAKVKVRTLADVIAFNRTHADREMPLFGQDQFLQDEATAGEASADYRSNEAEAHRLAGPAGIDTLLADHQLTALVAPTLGPAWLIDPVLKDRFVGGDAGSAAAVAGYPHLTVPMGQVDGLPVGLSIVGPAWSEARLLGYGYAFEQAAQARRSPTLAPTVTAESEAVWQSAITAPPKPKEHD
jgi:amidase